MWWRWYRRATEEVPSDATSFIFLGDIQARQGKLAVAEEAYHRAIQCTEGFIDEAHYNLGLVFRGQGRFREAAECFRKAIEMDSEYEVAVVALEDVERAMALYEPYSD